MYCGDSGIEDGIFLSALSVCKNAGCKGTACIDADGNNANCNNADENGEKIDFYILTASYGKYTAIGEDFQKKLQSAIGPCGSVTVLDISRCFLSYLPKANLSTRFTPLCMLRLFADQIPKIPDRILYLDADVLCRKSLDELYFADLDDLDFLAVPDRYGKWFFGNILKHDYLNSGVLLLNMEKIRKDRLFERCRELCAKEKMFMPDQTALNKLGKKGKLKRKFNEQGKIKNDTVLKHFTTYFRFFPYFKAVTIKPWQKELHTKLKIYEFDDIINRLKENSK